MSGITNVKAHTKADCWVRKLPIPNALRLRRRGGTELRFGGGLVQVTAGDTFVIPPQGCPP